MKNTSKTYEFALFSIHPHLLDQYKNQYPEFLETLNKQEGFHHLSTFFSVENPLVALDFAGWESPISMQNAGERLMQSEAGKRLFAPISEVKFMEATHLIYESGVWTGQGSLSLIVYRLKSLRPQFESLRNALYSEMTSLSTGISVRQFESQSQSGLFFDLFQSPTDPETTEKLQAFYAKGGMTAFEETIHPPEHMLSMELFLPESMTV